MLSDQKMIKVYAEKIIREYIFLETDVIMYWNVYNVEGKFPLIDDLKSKIALENVAFFCFFLN